MHNQVDISDGWCSIALHDLRIVSLHDNILREAALTNL